MSRSHCSSCSRVVASAACCPAARAASASSRSAPACVARAHSACARPRARFLRRAARALAGARGRAWGRRRAPAARPRAAQAWALARPDLSLCSQARWRMRFCLIVLAPAMYHDTAKETGVLGGQRAAPHQQQPSSLPLVGCGRAGRACSSPRAGVVTTAARPRRASHASSEPRPTLAGAAGGSSPSRLRVHGPAVCGVCQSADWRVCSTPATLCAWRPGQRSSPAVCSWPCYLAACHEGLDCQHSKEWYAQTALVDLPWPGRPRIYVPAGCTSGCNASLHSTNGILPAPVALAYRRPPATEPSRGDHQQAWQSTGRQARRLRRRTRAWRGCPGPPSPGRPAPGREPGPRAAVGRRARARPAPPRPAPARRRRRAPGAPA